MTKTSNDPICYLCGEPIRQGEQKDDEHVPPKQFFAKALRQSHNLKLLTLPAHHSCNVSYKDDEDYFRTTLAPLAKDTAAGKPLMEDLRRAAGHQRCQPLLQMVLGQFTEVVGGIYLPAGIVAINYDADRIARVIWKIIRGLYFHENGTLLPESTAANIRVLSPGEEPPEWFQHYVLSAEAEGNHQGIFAYKKYRHSNPDLHAWGLLFWDTIIVIVAFHDPQCGCATCRGQ